MKRGLSLNGLPILTGLVVAHVRYIVQYGYFPWESVGQFLTAWFVHYIAVCVVIGVSYVITASFEKFFIDQSDSRKGISVDEAFVYFSIVILTIAVLVFLVAHWPAGDPY